MMMMKHGLWKSRTFRFWLICDLVVLLIPLIFSSVLQSHTARQLENRAYEDGTNAVNLLASVTDERFSTVYSLANTLCSSSDLIKLRFVELPFNAEKYYDVHQRAGTLAQFTAASDLVLGCYVYCQNLDCILDAHHIYTRTNQYSRIIRQQFGLSEETFEQLVSVRHQGDLYVAQGGQRLLLVKSVSTGLRSEVPPLTLIVSLDPAAFSNLFIMNGENWQGAAYLLLPDEALLDDMEATGWLTSDRHLRTAEESVVLTQTSQIAEGVRYALEIPRARITADSRNSTLLFIYFALCTLVLGCGLAYLLLRHNYKPVHELTLTIDDGEKGGSSLSNVTRRVREMREELARLSLIEDQHLFEALLSGKFAQLEEEQRQSLRRDFEGDLFVVALLESEQEETEENDPELLAEELRKVLLEEAGDACQLVIRPYRDDLAAVLCFEKGNNTYDTQAFTQNLFKTVMAKHPKLPAVSVYIGEAHEGLQGVGPSCEEAEMACEYTHFVSKTGRLVVLFDETMVSSQISWEDYDIVDAERRFVSAMLAGEYTAGEQMMREIVSYYTGHEGLPLRVMQARMYGVMNMMINVLHEVEPSAESGVSPERDSLETLLQARTMQELEDGIFRILNRLQDRHDQTQSQLSSKLDAVIRYIGANYYDENLSVQFLAEKFELSLPYLSREFKNSQGIGVLNYINQYRVEKAKEILLREEDTMLTEIARRVGYSSSQTLIRIFKRYEGVTPGQFRANQKNTSEM